MSTISNETKVSSIKEPLLLSKISLNKVFSPEDLEKGFARENLGPFPCFKTMQFCGFLLKRM